MMSEIDDYIGTLDDQAREIVAAYYASARRVVPEASDGKSYGMAALRYRNRPLVSVVATKRGFSLFPFSTDVVERARPLLSDMESTKGGFQFTAQSAVPMDVFDRIVLDRRDEIDAALAHRSRP